MPHLFQPKLHGNGSSSVPRREPASHSSRSTGPMWSSPVQTVPPYGTVSHPAIHPYINGNNRTASLCTFLPFFGNHSLLTLIIHRGKHTYKKEGESAFSRLSPTLFYLSYGFCLFLVDFIESFGSTGRRPIDPTSITAKHGYGHFRAWP